MKTIFYKLFVNTALEKFIDLNQYIILMNTKNALIISSLITLLLGLNFYLLQIINPVSIELEEIKLERVIDGDTIDLIDGRRLRLLNINTPEKNTPIAKESIEFLQNLSGEYLKAEITGTEKNGRELARIFNSSFYINLEIIKKGLGNKFLVSKNELKQFAKAEKEAIYNERGIWKRSKYYDCFSISINAKSEEVKIKSECGQINFNSWKLKDESTKVYVFPNIVTDSLSLHSGKGKNSKTDLYWGAENNIWNNDRDTLYLFDSEWRFVQYETYGY